MSTYDFMVAAKKAVCNWIANRYAVESRTVAIDWTDVFIVWQCKTLQNHKAMQERGVVQIPLCFLAKSLENMSKCHVAYFCKGWQTARGCRIEHEAAKAYGIAIIYEE